MWGRGGSREEEEEEEEPVEEVRLKGSLGDSRESTPARPKEMDLVAAEARPQSLPPRRAEEGGGGGSLVGVS